MGGAAVSPLLLFRQNVRDRCVMRSAKIYLRSAVFAGAMILSTGALAAGPIVMHRDPGCGCCMKWAAQVRQALGREVRVVDDSNRAGLQRKFGIHPALSGCHTAVIDGMAFEGHVPIADIQSALKARPKGVRGLAVAGMPLGSPGMEVPGRPVDRYNVIAFGNGNPVIFARH